MADKKANNKVDNKTNNNFVQVEQTPEQALEQSELEEKAVLTTTDEKTFVHVPFKDDFLWIGQSTSFQEVDRLEVAQEQTDEVNKTTSVFRGLVDNILLFADPEDRSTLLKSVVEGFSARLSVVLSGLKSKNTKDAEQEVSPFIVYKNKNDQWRFFSTYSNNIRDDDTPPEIISKASHRRFVNLVDSGEVPPPALWLWHMKDLEIGQTDVVAFDDETGIAMAAGHFHEFANPIAETINTNPDVWGVSHGMPTLSIARNKDDQTIIEEHITKEISPLPRGKEANRWADFVALKEANMGLTQAKLDELNERGISNTLIANIQANNVELSKAADEAGLERKEGDEIPLVETPATETPAETPAVEPVAEPVVVEPVVTPVEEVPVEAPVVETPAASPVEVPVTPVTPAEPVVESPTEPTESSFSDEQTKELITAFTALTDGIIDAVTKQIDAKLVPLVEAKSESDKAAEEILNLTPIASLQDAIINKEYLKSHSAVGDNGNLVDGRTVLGKDAPVETQAGEENLLNTGDPLLDMLGTDIITQRNLNELREPV